MIHMDKPEETEPVEKIADMLEEQLIVALGTDEVGADILGLAMRYLRDQGYVSSKRPASKIGALGASLSRKIRGPIPFPDAERDTAAEG